MGVPDGELADEGLRGRSSKSLEDRGKRMPRATDPHSVALVLHRSLSARGIVDEASTRILNVSMKRRKRSKDLN